MTIISSKYKLIPIQSISFDAFFELIDSNREYIKKGFSGTVKRCKTKASAKVLFDEWILEEEKENTYSFFIKKTASADLLGLINVKNIDRGVKKCEIGFFISETIASKGVTSSLTSEIVSFCFEKLELNKIFLRISPENIGSQKVALKNGFKEEGVLRQEYKGHQDILEDVMYFGLLRNEYLK